eukprot:849214-Pelagomonas_calceolata.AAC.1
MEVPFTSGSTSWEVPGPRVATCARTVEERRRPGGDAITGAQAHTGPGCVEGWFILKSVAAERKGAAARGFVGKEAFERQEL